MALIDEQQSDETAKHVSRGLRENARQGFWNGSASPLGYIPVEVERRGVKVKKRLEIVETEAELVRLIFRLTVEGDGEVGPMGMKDITSWLNANGYKTKRGRRFYVDQISRILHGELYTGSYWYGRTDARTGKELAQHEWISVQVPPIISRELFDRVQQIIHDRRPDVTAPRISNSGLMLGGIARCGACGLGLMLRTGTGRSGVRHRYYVCSGLVKEGACRGGKSRPSY